jgi:tetratricopeptide (TPR) repeat protein
MFKTIRKIFLKPNVAPREEQSADEAMMRHAHPTNVEKSPLQKGNEYLQSRDLEQAARCYREAIAADPNDSNPYINLGFVLLEKEQFEEAALHLQKACQLAPGNADAWYLLGNVSNKLGRPDEAIEYFNKLLTLRPNFEIVYTELGQLLSNSGRHVEARQLIERGIEHCPHQASFYHILGQMLLGEAAYVEAASNFRKGIGIAPEQGELHVGLANALLGLGQPEEALMSSDVAIRLAPDSEDAWKSRAAIQLKLKRHLAVLESVEHLQSLNPRDAAPIVLRGLALQGQKRNAEAALAYESALEIAPDLLEAHVNLSLLLLALNRYDEAIEHGARATRIKPNSLEAHINYSAALNHAGRSEEALVISQEAIALAPQSDRASSCRIAALMSLNRIQEAINEAERLLSLNPDHAETYLARAMCQLLAGDLLQGWKDYEWRWREREFLQSRIGYTQPLWLGKESLEGKTILLHFEQGYGDTIQFCRYAKLVAERGAKVIVSVQPGSGFKSLFAELEGVADIVEGKYVGTCDYQTPLMSLPLAFQTSADTIPAQIPYLRPEPKQVAKWDARLGKKLRPRVGVAWSGSKDHKNDRNRSLALSAFCDCLIQGIDVVSLQKEMRAGDQEALAKSGILFVGEEIRDFSDTAGLVANMDLIISVDTSVAHLAGALGKPVWILLPFSPDWRWMLEREDTPWYPNGRLFRQPKIGDWSGVTKKLAVELATWLSQISDQKH